MNYRTKQLELLKELDAHRLDFYILTIEEDDDEPEPDTEQYEEWMDQVLGVATGYEAHVIRAIEALRNASRTEWTLRGATLLLRNAGYELPTKPDAVRDLARAILLQGISTITDPEESAARKLARGLPTLLSMRQFARVLLCMGFSGKAASELDTLLRARNLAVRMRKHHRLAQRAMDRLSTQEKKK